MESNLSSSSAFDSLPDELIDHIVHIIDSESTIKNLDVHPNLKTLSALSRTSSKFNSKCLPLLLETIRLPLTHTPIGSPSPLLISARDSVALKLARTLRHNQESAQMVRELEITCRWFPEDGMERCREAYTDILNASTNACAIAFYVGRGEYGHVLESIKSSYPNLVCLSIGVENLERDLKIPFLQPQLDPKLEQSSSSTSDPTQSTISTPRLRLTTSYACPNLVHLHLQLPSYVILEQKTNLILSSLPPSIQHLEISSLSSPSELSQDSESDLSIDLGPGKKIFQIVASLFRTRFVRKPTKVDDGNFQNQENKETDISFLPTSFSSSLTNKIEIKLQSLTMRFSDGGSSFEKNQRAIEQLKSRKDLALYFPSEISNDSQTDQDPYIKSGKTQIEYQQPDQLLRLVQVVSPEVTNLNGQVEPVWLPPISRAAESEGLLLWRSALNDNVRKSLIKEKKLEVLNRRKARE